MNQSAALTENETSQTQAVIICPSVAIVRLDGVILRVCNSYVKSISFPSVDGNGVRGKRVMSVIPA